LAITHASTKTTAMIDGSTTHCTIVAMIELIGTFPPRDRDLLWL
jgi:hypothetical protein